MSKIDALNAYRDSLYDAAKHEFSMRASSRSTPIIGGLVDGLKLLGNALFRPIKILAALTVGYTPKYSQFPPMPEIPSAFAGTELGKAFADSWPLNEQAAEASVKSFTKLLDLDIQGAWQEASVANYAKAKEDNFVFIDEAAARDARNSATKSFADAVISSRSGQSGGKDI